MTQAKIGQRAIVWLAGAWLATGLLPAQTAPEPGIWPPPAGSLWQWVVPRTDLAPERVEAAFAQAVAEGTAFVDAKFSATIFFARKIRLTAGKSRDRKRYPGRPEKADDLRIEAEWQNGYLNQYRGRSYCFIALDSIRGLDLHYLPDPRQRFPKAPPGRNWSVNILAGSLFSFFFVREESARDFIHAVASAVGQRGLDLTFSRFGLMWENVTPMQAADMGRPAGGVLVTRLAVGGPADRAGVRFLDAVLEVNGVPVANFSHFSLLLDAAAPGSSSRLLLLRRLKEPHSAAGPSAWETLAVEMEAR